MKQLFTILSLLALLSCRGQSGLLGTIAAPVSYSGAPNVIYLTDGDIDANDAHALVMMVDWHTRGYINLKAVCTDADSETAAPASKAILEYYGLASLPFGAYKGSATYGAEEGAGSASRKTRDQFKPGVTRSAYPDALPVLREVLAGCADNSVYILSGGFGVNLSDLLNSTADSYSTLTGAQLISAKVKELYAVGGWWPSSSDLASSPQYSCYLNNYNGGGAPLREWNVRMDIASWQNVVTNWPTRLVFFGAEMPYLCTAQQINVAFPSSMPTTNPAKYFEQNSSTPGARPAWEELMLVHLRTPDVYTVESAAGSITVGSDGQTTHTPGAGTRYYITPNGAGSDAITHIEQYLNPS